MHENSVRVNLAAFVRVLNWNGAVQVKRDAALILNWCGLVPLQQTVIGICMIIRILTIITSEQKLNAINENRINFIRRRLSGFECSRDMFIFRKNMRGRFQDRWENMR